MMDSVKAKVQSVLSSSTPPQSHQAAILPEKGARFQIDKRPTPQPKENEILVQVKSIALNPVDIAQRDMGFNTTEYPGVLGSDVGGIVAATGSAVSHFIVGQHVTAFAPAFDMHGSADYGAFQEYVLCPAAYAAKIPKSMTFNEAAMLPMAVETVMAGCYSIGLPTKYSVPDGEKKGMLVWGGSSSVGSAAVQIAKDMGFVVYATASSKHHEYVKSLGASMVFEYKDEDVATKIVETARGDGVKLDIAYDAAGSLPQILDILSQCSSSGKVASAIPLGEESPERDGIETRFVLAPTEVKERTRWASWVFHEWLEERLEKKMIVPSPKMEVLAGGLEALNVGLDKLKQGVSGTKLVIEV